MYIHRETTPAQRRENERILEGWRERRKSASARRAQTLAPAISVLEQLSRPVHAVAAATREDIRDVKAGRLPVGQGSLQKAKEGFELKDRSLFSDVLGDLGVRNKALRGVGGFALDVALDPTTYLSFGTTTVARKGAESAARKATKDELSKGASRKAANRSGRAAADLTRGAESNRGLQVGFGSLKTSGRTSAKLDRALRLDRAAERVRASGPATVVRQVNPRIRPAGVSEKDFDNVRSAMRRSRAISHAGEQRARNIAQAVARTLPGDRHPRIVDALESRSLAGLSEKEQRVAIAMAKEFDDIYRAEQRRGLVGRKFQDFGYFPRRPASELEPGGSRKRLNGAALVSSKARTNRKRHAEFRGTADDVYTENAAVALYLRARDSAVKVGRKEVIDALHGAGRRWHPKTDLREGDAVYRFSRDQMPVEVQPDDLKKLIADGGAADAAALRVIPKELVRVASQGAPERLEGIDDVVHRVWDRQIQGRVKTVLTVINPQYHATNLYGDLFNAYKGSPSTIRLLRDLGISSRALVYRARREAAAKTLGKQLDPSDKGVKIGGRNVPFDQLIKEAEDHGAINQGFIGRDLAEVLDNQGKEAAQRLGQSRIGRRSKVAARVATSRAGSRVSHPIETIRDASQYREDAVRLAMYLGGRKRGLTPDRASEFANQHLIDYGDLTTFERSVLRRVFPFWTFTARNAPQQARALVERPGKFANLEKLRQEASAAFEMPEDWQDRLQPWEQEGQPIPVGRNKDGTPQLLFLKLPSTDLRRLSLSPTEQANYLLSMVTPILKSPVEYTQNFNFFFREKIDELLDETGPAGESVRTLKPAPKWLVDALPEKARDAMHIRRYTDKRTGKRIWGWPAKLDYLLKQTPLSGTALQFGTGVPNTRGQTQGQRILGYMTGLKISPFDETTITERRVGQRYGYLQAKGKAMRSQGDAYDRNGGRTPAYQRVLDETREMADRLGISGRGPAKPPLGSGVQLSSEAREALKGAGGVQLSEEARSALRGLSAP